MLDSLNNYTIPKALSGFISSHPSELQVPANTYTNLLSDTQPSRLTAVSEGPKLTGITHNDGSSKKLNSGPPSMHRAHNNGAYQDIPESYDTYHRTTKRVLYLSNVPKLVRFMTESKRSLLDKVLHHFRSTRRCLAVIRSDILGVRRFTSPTSLTDVVEVCFSQPFFIEELINLEHRILACDIPLPSTAIVLRLHLPVEFHQVPLLGHQSSLAPRGNQSDNLDEVD